MSLSVSGADNKLAQPKPVRTYCIDSLPIIQKESVKFYSENVTIKNRAVTKPGPSAFSQIVSKGESQSGGDGQPSKKALLAAEKKKKLALQLIKKDPTSEGNQKPVMKTQDSGLVDPIDIDPGMIILASDSPQHHSSDPTASDNKLSNSSGLPRPVIERCTNPMRPTQNFLFSSAVSAERVGSDHEFDIEIDSD